MKIHILLAHICLLAAYISFMRGIFASRAWSGIIWLILFISAAITAAHQFHLAYINS